jgi:hypothetical protein
MTEFVPERVRSAMITCEDVWGNPLNPPEGALVVVLFTDMFGGLRGRVPCKETMGFIEATRVSMEG